MKMLPNIVLTLCLFCVNEVRGSNRFHPIGCAMDTHRPPDGNLKQTAQFPWLGVLRMRIEEHNKVQVAITGIVLVKYNYAIANADDVTVLTQDLLLKQSQAMFIPEDSKPWLVDVLSAIHHPDYDNPSIRALSLIELNTLGGMYTVLPACLPKLDYNSSMDWYVIGFTDERMALEKILYKAGKVSDTNCDLFYNRGGTISSHPSKYVCANAPSNSHHCDWDNGMAMASNTSGVWVLTGFSLRGPGCSGPTIFFDIIEYITWIHQMTAEIE